MRATKKTLIHIFSLLTLFNIFTNSSIAGLATYDVSLTDNELREIFRNNCLEHQKIFHQDICGSYDHDYPQYPVELMEEEEVKFSQAISKKRRSKLKHPHFEQNILAQLNYGEWLSLPGEESKIRTIPYIGKKFATFQEIETVLNQNAHEIKNKNMFDDLTSEEYLKILQFIKELHDKLDIIKNSPRIFHKRDTDFKFSLFRDSQGTFYIIGRGALARGAFKVAKMMLNLDEGGKIYIKAAQPIIPPTADESTALDIVKGSKFVIEIIDTLSFYLGTTVSRLNKSVAGKYSSVKAPKMLFVMKYYQKIGLTESEPLHKALKAPESYQDINQNPFIRLIKWAYSNIVSLDEIHDKEVCHYDLKEGNIFFNEDGFAILADFGFSRHYSNLRNNPCGTPEYICPAFLQRAYQNLRGKSVIVGINDEGKGDLWSVGVMMDRIINPNFTTASMELLRFKGLRFFNDFLMTDTKSFKEILDKRKSIALNFIPEDQKALYRDEIEAFNDLIYNGILIPHLDERISLKDAREIIENILKSVYQKHNLEFFQQ